MATNPFKDDIESGNDGLEFSRGNPETENGTKFNTPQRVTLDDIDDTYVKGSKEAQREKGTKQPGVVLSHIIFKAGALIAYLLCEYFTSGFVISFVTVVLLLSVDFWVVKNVTGRLLVGLRWWNEINEDGSSSWVFESRQDMDSVNPVDSRVFWTGLWLSPLLWVLMAIVSFFKGNIGWLLLIIIALTLNGANVVGYMKCSKASRKKLEGFAERYVAAKMFSSLTGGN